MDKPKIKAKHGPEFRVQARIKKFLEARGWHVERLVGFQFQSGLPDLIASHIKFGFRPIEVKIVKNGKARFTKAQRHKFPVLVTSGWGIWILSNASEIEYEKLFQPPNLVQFLKLTDYLSTEKAIDEIKKCDLN